MIFFFKKIYYEIVALLLLIPWSLVLCLFQQKMHVTEFGIKKQTNKQTPLKHSVQVVPIVVFLQKGYTAFFVKRVEIISEESPSQPV